MDSMCDAEMPRYQSHKQVWALEIKGTGTKPGVRDTDPNVDQAEPDVVLFFSEEGYAPMAVRRAVVSRYFPKPGDFFVVYDDGYQSISPRKAFLEGYTRLR